MEHRLFISHNSKSRVQKFYVLILNPILLYRGNPQFNPHILEEVHLIVSDDFPIFPMK